MTESDVAKNCMAHGAMSARAHQRRQLRSRRHDLLRSHGEMAVRIAPDVERMRAGAGMTPEEAKIALTDYIAYFGTYSIDQQGGTVTHHRHDSVQPGDRGDLVRRFELDGDRLLLRPLNSTLTWELIK